MTRIEFSRESNINANIRIATGFARSAIYLEIQAMSVNAPSQSKTHTESKNGAPMATDLRALIDGLNEDLAGEYQAILMYIQYSAKLTGPYRRELRALFQSEIADEQGHAQFLADKIRCVRRRTND